MNPTKKGPLRFVINFERKVGGAELNFDIGIARLGITSKWIRRMGNDDFEKVIYNFARGEGVDVSDVELVKEYPTSLNIKEIKEDGYGNTYYYRYNSPISTLEPEDITDDIFQDVDVVHLTGVFLSLDEKNRHIVKKII